MLGKNIAFLLSIYHRGKKFQTLFDENSTYFPKFVTNIAS